MLRPTATGPIIVKPVGRLLMDHFYFYLTLWFLVTCWLIWDSKRTNALLHERHQTLLREIARYLGTDRR